MSIVGKRYLRRCFAPTFLIDRKVSFENEVHMDLYNETIEILKKYNIRANKNLGQNFLIDKTIVNKIIENSNISNSDLIIEIGPGLGTLTRELSKRAGKVVAIELDLKMVNILKPRFANDKNIEIIHGDVLKLDLKHLMESTFKTDTFKRVKLVANLPYYITTPIIMKLLEEVVGTAWNGRSGGLDNTQPLQSIVVMVQKEVADRLVATPGDKLSGAITYAIHYYCKPEMIINVSNDSFIPTPEVESSVIVLNVLDGPSIKVSDEQLFFRVIKRAFSQRRKTFVNALYGFEELDKSEIITMLEELHIDTRIRGEKLTMEEYREITEYICHFKQIKNS